jgi:prolyl-tRNA editing enzyme YbaK/EbsC (Cys-tRNA(Pro) deacylase)
MAASAIDEQVHPERVRRTLDWFRRHGLWCKLSRNSVATSCRDAAARRHRLGHVGIPLYDELKSLCVAVYRGGERRFALLHCRATSRFDLEAARCVLHADRPLARVSSDELERRFKTAYGTVTPFAEPTEFIQVLDAGVLTRLTAPFTMMTNAGEHTWGVEFHPDPVVEALHSETEVHVAHVTLDREEPVRLPAFGILTGNGPESGQDLWQRLNDAIHTELSRQGRMYGDLSYPKVCVLSAPEMGLSMELDDRWEEVARVVDRGVDALCAAGATVLAIACNTTQVFAERIRARCADRGVELMTMADVVSRYVGSNPGTAFTLVGIPVGREPRRAQPISCAPQPRRPTSCGARATAPPGSGVHGQAPQAGREKQPGAQQAPPGHSIRREHVARDRRAHRDIGVLMRRFPKLAAEISGRTLIDPLQLYAEALAERYIRELPSAVEDTDDLWVPRAGSPQFGGDSRAFYRGCRDGIGGAPGGARSV